MRLKNKIIAMVPVWNAAGLIEKCLATIAEQDFDDVGIIIREDRSTDDTAAALQRLLGIDGVSEIRCKFCNRDVIYIKNQKKMYSLGNIVESVKEFTEDDSIIAVVDGDDELFCTDAFSAVWEVYRDLNKWVVWTQYMHRTGGIGHCKMIPETYLDRNHWDSSHMRTMKSFLIKNIKWEDLKDIDGEDRYMHTAGDCALMYPCIEMAGRDRCYFLNKVCYHYNNNLPTNDHHRMLDTQRRYADVIKSRKPYNKLERN